MNLKQSIAAAVVALFVLVGCTSETKKEAKEVKEEKVALAISGMTCEIGCAKTIQSKLSKKEGVIDAKVIFNDSIANIVYDGNTTSKEDLIAFVDGIAGGDMYKASETGSKAHECTEACKEECKTASTESEKMECKENCQMACCKDKTE